MKNLFLLAATVGTVLAQDPAPGWLGYATAKCPSGRITFIDGYWKVGATPPQSNSFYSPWFGIDASDNLNLLQPVNPWMGNEWLIYNEYFQWSPEYNYNSAQHQVKAGDLLYGSITFNPNNQSYTIYHNVSGSTTWEVSTNIVVQKDGRKGGYKNYTIAYFVYEKPCPCADYPSDGKVTFTNINVQCDNAPITPNWSTSYVEDVCDNRAHVIDSSTIEITWNTKAQDPAPELIAKSQSDRRFGRPSSTILRGN